MADYIGTRKKAPVKAPPPVYFGPSSCHMINADGGTQYAINLWVGGKGLAEDGHGGVTIKFTFDLQKGDHPGIRAVIGADPYREQFTGLWGEEAAEAITRALVLSAQGMNLSRPHTAAEIKEIVYDNAAS